MHMAPYSSSMEVYFNGIKKTSAIAAGTFSTSYGQIPPGVYDIKFMAAGSSNLWVAVAAISLAIGAHQAWTANIWSLVMDYTPKHMMSTVFGFGGMCAAIGGMFMTQIVGHILTVTNNNYTVLFTLIPAMYFIALTWMYFMAPRKIPTITE